MQRIIVKKFEHGWIEFYCSLIHLHTLKRSALLSSLSSSYLIKEGINKAQFFHICFMRKSQFVRSSSSEKIPPQIKSFFQTSQYPIVPDSDLVEIK